MVIFQIVTILLGVSSLGVGVLVIYMVKEFSKSMRQVSVDRGVFKALSEASVLAQTVAEDLRSNLAIQREEFQRLVILLDRMDTKITVGGETGLRNEAEGQRVRDNLQTAQAEVDRVADDLDIERTTPRPTKRAPRKRS